MAKKILFLTGTRADFGKLKPLIKEVERSCDLDYQIFATGMHMLARYGSTVNEIKKSGLDNIYLYINQDGSVNSAMDLALANTIQGLGHYIREFPPDLIVVHGDRVEALAGATVGALHNILVAHVEGGEVSGTVDELLRHAISKLSHVHFVANGEARNRLIQMGEFPETIYPIGSPDIDVMLSDDLPPIEEVKEKYEIPFDRYCVVLYHPVTTEPHELRERVRNLVDGLIEAGRKYVVLYPNNDSGSEMIFEEYRRLRGRKNFRVLPSMRFEFFLSLLRQSSGIIGNSSAGIHEAPVYGVPTLNLGNRQLNRFAHSSIVNVPEVLAKIVEALAMLPERVEPTYHFGRGESAKAFKEKLQDPGFWQISKQKQFRDLSMRGYPVNSVAA